MCYVTTVVWYYYVTMLCSRTWVQTGMEWLSDSPSLAAWGWCSKVQSNIMSQNSGLRLPFDTVCGKSIEILDWWKGHKGMLTWTHYFQVQSYKTLEHKNMSEINRNAKTTPFEIEFHIVSLWWRHFASHSILLCWNVLISLPRFCDFCSLDVLLW